MCDGGQSTTDDDNETSDEGEDAKSSASDEIKDEGSKEKLILLSVVLKVVKIVMLLSLFY